MNKTVKHSVEDDDESDDDKNMSIVVTNNFILQTFLRYEGFAIDLADKLAGILHFNHTFRIVADKKVHGKPAEHHKKHP